MASQPQTLEPKIRAILTAPGTDLATISAKRVRKQLVEDDRSLSDFVREQKKEIDNLIAQVYERISEQQQQAGNGGAGGGGGDEDDEDDDEVESSTTSKRKREDASDDEGTVPPKKTKKAKTKTKTKQQKTDEEIARQLQNEINGRGRSSRAGASSSLSKKANGTKRGKKKSAETVGSDAEDAESGAEGKKKRGGGGFKKEYMLSEPLAALLGVDKLSRPQTVKQLWTHIKANNMQNPENKKEIICDDRFKAIFKCDRIDMFKMNKELGQHLYEPPAAAE